MELTGNPATPTTVAGDSVKPPAEGSGYFPGLNSIRFLAALAVFIFHVSDLLRYSGLLYVDTPDDLGQKGVAVFFVLSGFLITYLLLSEFRKTAAIQIGKFYMRRILRIWPLYYLVIFTGYFAFPYLAGDYASHKPAFNADFVLFLLLLPNLAGDSTSFVKQTWSVGVEEQFYLLWPWLIRKFHSKLPAVFMMVIVVKILAVIIVDSMIASLELPVESAYFLARLRNILYLFQIEIMAVGGIGAYLLVNKHALSLRFVFHPAVQLVNLALLTIIFVADIGSFRFANELIAVVAIIFIMNVAANPNAVIRLRGAVFDYLGRISYGIYMFHQMVIYLTILFLARIAGIAGNGPAFNAILYPVALFLTIMLASLSYFFFELPFIRLKKNFTVANPDK